LNYVIDTHTLFWYLFDTPRLSGKVDKIMSGIESGASIVDIGCSD